MISENVTVALHVWQTVKVNSGKDHLPRAHPEIESHQSCLFNLGGFVASYKKVHLLCKALNAFSPLCFNKSDSRVSLGRGFSTAN